MLFLYVPLIIIAGLALWYMATHPAPTAHAPSMATTTASGSALGPQSLSDSGQYYKIDASYPGSTSLLESAGAAADANAVAAMKGFETQTITQFKEESGLNNLTAEDIKIQGLSADRFYALSLTYETHQSPSTVSYIYQIYADTLGAHPNGAYRTFTFDKKTGASLQLADLFVANAAYLTQLSTISRTQIAQTLGENVDTTYLNSGTTPKAENFQDFYLDGANLVLVFPPYQVGPYAIGTQQVTIPLVQLKTSLKAQYVQ